MLLFADHFLTSWLVLLGLLLVADSLLFTILLTFKVQGLTVRSCRRGSTAGSLGSRNVLKSEYVPAAEGGGGHSTF